MRIQSIKFKISVLYSVTLGVLLFIYSIFLYLTLSNGLSEDLDSELIDKAQQIIHVIDEFHRSTYKKGSDIDRNLDTAVDMVTHFEYLKDNSAVMQATGYNWLKSFDQMDLSEDYIVLLNVASRQPFYTNNVTDAIKATLLEAVSMKNTGESLLKNIRLQNEGYRIIQEPFYFEDKLKYIILIATSQRTLATVLEERRNVIFFSIPFVLILTILIGKFYSDRLVKPLIEVANVAEHVTHKDLTQRIETRYSDEEIKIMVGAFNKMIDRLQKAFGHIADFNSHVAHELKTPLSIINGECEVALRREQTAADYKETLEAVLEESKKMLKITEDLLLLARADYIPDNFVFDEFNIREFFEEICAKCRMLAAEKNIKVSFEFLAKARTATGDALHLRRLFLNIVHNAVKFTPPSGSIGIIVKANQKNLIVDITDSGIGIPAKEIGKIFDQFYQKSPMEFSSARGIGLGLSIALALAKIHNGRIKVQSTEGRGSTFTIILPVITPFQKTQEGIYAAT